MGREVGKEIFMSNLNELGEKEKLTLSHSFVAMV